MQGEKDSQNSLTLIKIITLNTEELHYENYRKHARIFRIQTLR